MITSKEIKQLIYQDTGQKIENAGWLEKFYELWMERYHALDAVRLPSQVLKLNREVLLELMNSYDFDEMHLFKIYEDANVYALLKDEGQGYWAYQFVIIYRSNPSAIANRFNSVDEVKDHFDHKEPVLEIPLPRDRKYIIDKE